MKPKSTLDPNRSVIHISEDFKQMTDGTCVVLLNLNINTNVK